MTRSELFKSALIAISLGSLWFLRFFRVLLYPSDFRYFDAEVPRWFDYAAILVCVASIAFVVLVLRLGYLYFSNKVAKILFQFLFFGVGLASFGSASSEIITWASPTAHRFVNLPGPLLILAVCIACSYKERFALGALVSRLSSVALIFVPLAAVLIFQTFFFWFSGGEKPLEPRMIAKAPTPNLASKVKTKVIWIIFDELGYSAMMDRPRSVEMPAIDEVMSQSWVAENAFPPDYDTRDSIPALLTGKPLKIARPIADNDLLLLQNDGQTTTFRNSETTVTDIRGMSGNVAVVGWYHPYPRLFADSAAIASFKSYQPRTCADLKLCTTQILLRSIENVPLAYRVLMFAGIRVIRDRLDVEYQVIRNRFLQEKSLEALSKPGVDFYFFHFSVPHHPFINKEDEPARRGYFGALEAADKIFGEIRASLETSGNWENTAIIISGDHWWRGKSEASFSYLDSDVRTKVLEDTRVPFIVKFPGETSGETYKRPFNTVITRFLITAIARGEIRTVDEMNAWLDKMNAERPDLINFRPGVEGN